MRLIDADVFDKMLVDAQAECKSNGGNFRFGVLSNVRENLRMMPTIEQELRWIPVSERLPDEEEAVEIWLKYDKIVFTAYLHKEWWVVCGTWGEKEFAKHEVSHWRKPQPPQMD